MFYVSIILYSSLNFFPLGQENNIAYFNVLKTLFKLPCLLVRKNPFICNRGNCVGYNENYT